MATPKQRTTFFLLPCLLIGGSVTLWINCSSESDQQVRYDDPSSTLVEKRLRTLSIKDQVEIAERLNQEMREQQERLSSGTLTVDGYHHWLYEWSEANKGQLSLLQNYSPDSYDDSLSKLGIVHHEISTPASPERIDASRKLQELELEQQDAMGAFSHLAATDPIAFQEALQKWDYEHGESFRKRRAALHEIIVQHPVEVTKTVELPPNATEDMKRYKELCESRVAFFSELTEMPLSNDTLVADWQQTLRENEESLTLMSAEIQELKTRIVSKK